MTRAWTAVLVAGALLLGGCGGPSIPDDPDAPTADVSADVEHATPDVVGLALDVAREALNDAGVDVAEEVDLDEGKSIWNPANWTVVEQSDSADGVVLGVTNHADAQREADREARDAAREEEAAADEDRSAMLEAAIKTALGVDQFSELFAQDPSLWGGWITGVRVERSNATITLQVGADDPLRDELGERAARALTTLLPAADLDGIDWIITEDASGVVIAQEMI